MKTLHRICAATILSLTLAVSVLAGHIETPGAPAAVPPAPVGSGPTNVTTTIVLLILSLVR